MGLFRRKEPPSFTTLVARMKDDYAAGRYREVFRERHAYGYRIGEDAMPRHEWFWFNALGALAGIKLGHDPLVGELAGYCGYATTCVDWNDTAERAAKEEIERFAFG